MIALRRPLVGIVRLAMFPLVYLCMASFVARASASACVDSDQGATDPDGWGCSQYLQQYCGGYYDDDDFSSDVMCCVCGGGEASAGVNLSMQLLANCAPVCDLSSTNLIGTIPTQIGNLTNMEVLHLHHNGLTGTIPSEIGKLVKCRELSLSENALTGTIETVLGLLTQMQKLRLDGNQLIGTIPSILGALTRMDTLLLSSNQFTGPLPSEIGRATAIKELRLDDNQLTSSIPSEIGSLTDMVILKLSSNKFAGILPSEIGNLGNLEHLVIEAFNDKQSSGTIPSEVGRLTKAWNVNLKSCGFRGTIPSEIGSLTSSQYLNLYSNNLGGTIPSEIGNLTRMHDLQLGDNDLSGSLPSEIWRLTGMAYLTLNLNQLVGTISAAIGGLSNMRGLYLGGNTFTGTIPSEIGNLTDIQYLEANANPFSGTIPTEIGRCTQMYYFVLASNNVTGTIPSEIGNFARIVWLAIGTNSLTGIVPSEIGLLTSLYHLDFAELLLSGSIPSEIGLTSIQQLRLQSNRLTGTMPSEIGLLSGMTELRVSFNALKGTIPLEIGDLPYIRALDLKFNLFTGTIPAEIGFLSETQELDIRKNWLTGTVPSEIGRLTAMREFYASDNYFSGVFPDISSMTLLTILELSYNMLTSIAGPAIYSAKIEVAGNHFSELPPSLLHLPSTSSLNLSFNALSSWTSRGVVPHVWHKGTDLVFCGYSLEDNEREPIKWPMLKTLDVSGNKFGGLIRDFFYSLSHVPSLVSISARGCEMHGVLSEVGFKVSMKGTGDEQCNNLPNTDFVFPSLFFLELSDNLIEDLQSPPRNQLTFASFTGNNISRVHPDWWNWKKSSNMFDLRLRGNAFLRQHVLPPGTCPLEPTGFMSDLAFFSPPSSNATHECTVPCRGYANIQVDSSIGLDMLCRCREGYGGQGTSCQGCNVNEYEHHVGSNYTVSKCVSCPRHSDSNGVRLGSGILHCKCMAGFYMDVSNSACQECAPGKFSGRGGAFECQPCEMGYFASRSGSTSCDQCAMGFFSNGVGNTACDSCQKGSYLNYPGGTECTFCTAGRFVALMPDTNLTACKRCEKGTFGGDRGLTECSTCEPGLTTAGLGSENRTECICPEDKVLIQIVPQMTCGACFEGMACESGSVAWTLADDRSLAGQELYFPRILPGYMTLADPYSVYRCLSTQACPGGDVHTCGSNMEGIACATCKKGYYRLDGQCRRCDTASVAPFVVSVCCVIAVALVMCMIINREVVARRQSDALRVALGSVFWSAAQTLGVFSTLDTAWTEPVHTVVDFFSVLSFDLELLRLDCILGSEPFGFYVFRQCMGPAAVVIIFGYIMCIKRPSKKSIWVIMCNTTGFFGNVFFISFLLSAVSPFVCYSHPGESGSSMIAAPSILCFDVEVHWKMVALGLVGVLAVVVPILAMDIYGIAHYRTWISGRGNEMRLRSFQFLFVRFNPQMYYFALILLFRSTLICLVPVVIRDGASIQIFAMIAIIGALGMVQMVLYPWGHPWANIADGISNFLLMLLLAFGLATQNEVDRFTLKVLALTVLIILALLVILGVASCLVLHLAPTPRYNSFICHHKGAAAAQARYLQLLLRAKAGQTVFIDSDDLQNLDLLFDYVACKIDHLIVYLTRQTLSRPWCAGEIVTAFRTRGKVKLSAVLHSSFEAPSKEERQNLQSYLDLSSCSLLEYGIPFDEISHAFVRLLDNQQTPQFEFGFDVKGRYRFEVLVSNLLKQNGKPPEEPCAPKDPGMIVVSSEPGNDEATAAAGILVHKLYAKLLGMSDALVYCVEDSDVNFSDLGRSVVSARAVVVLLSSGSLEAPAQLKVILEAMAASANLDKNILMQGSTSGMSMGESPSSSIMDSKQSSQSCHITLSSSFAEQKKNSPAAIPVITPGFKFPNAEFYEERLPLIWKHDSDSAERLIRLFFKRIGCTFDTFASDTVIEAQAQTVLSRIPANFDITKSKEWLPYFLCNAHFEKPAIDAIKPEVDADKVQAESTATPKSIQSLIEFRPEPTKDVIKPEVDAGKIEVESIAPLKPILLPIELRPKDLHYL